jgi:hypothetical protein
MENSVTIQIPSKSKIIVYWEDSPENYSRDEKKRIQNHFANKYNVDKKNIRVEYRPIKKNASGELIKIDGASIDNILDINHQRELFKEWLVREGRDVDFERLVGLDNKVNTELGDEFKNESINKKWKIKWITLDNFLSFGEGNTFNVDNLKGLTVINSLPENQGGKSTLVVDSIKYLLFGKTTKTDKNEEIFNQYSDGDEMVIKGLLEIEGEGDIVIERTMKRSKKRSAGWNVKNTLNYYRILPDGSEEILNEEHAIKTTEKIKEVVGTEKDFELIVLATARNLDDLIDFTSSESGKLLTRFIGLEVIEAKESIVRKMYNEFAKTMKSNQYNSSTLLEEVEQHKLKIVELSNDKTQVEVDIKTSSDKLIELNKEKMGLLGTKISIDVEILSMNPSKIESDVETLTNKGIKLSGEVKELTKKIDEIGSIKFDEDRHDELTKLVNKINTDVALKNAESQRLTKVVEDLIAGGICSACNRKLDDVDNSQHINEHNNTIGVIQKEVTSLKDKLGKYNSELIKLNETKKIVDNLSKLELEKSKLEVEISGLRNDIKSKKNDLKLYKQNLDAIEANKKVDIKVSLVDTNIKVEEHTKTELNNKLQRVIIDIDRNNGEIVNKTNIIDKITKETTIEKIYKTYIDMVGKKGISKLVLRSVLPIINSELQQLLEEVTDFDIEITIDEKNEVRYLLIKDEVEKQLKSGSGFERTAASLALRCVLGKMTKLSMPNFITLDEVLGRVAPINVERMKLLFDKLKDMYENIYFITQNEVVKDWADNIVTVLKENNISKIKS